MLGPTTPRRWNWGRMAVGIAFALGEGFVGLLVLQGGVSGDPLAFKLAVYLNVGLLALAVLGLRLTRRADRPLTSDGA